MIHKSTRLPFPNLSGALTAYLYYEFLTQEEVVGFWKAMSTVRILKRYETVAKRPFCPISMSGSNLNPQNTQCIQMVKIFALFEREQKRAFFRGFILRNSTNQLNSTALPRSAAQSLHRPDNGRCIDAIFGTQKVRRSMLNKSVLDTDTFDPNSVQAFII